MNCNIRIVFLNLYLLWELLGTSLSFFQRELKKVGIQIFNSAKIIQMQFGIRFGN